MTIKIRDATLNDVEAINRIANWYIKNTAVNFDTEAWSLQKRLDWITTFTQPDNPYHLLVAEDKCETIGFACNTRFRPKAAYDTSTETSVYIDHSVNSNGRGRLLYEALFELVNQKVFHRAYALITLPNPASVALHEKLGFQIVGVFEEVGMKFGKYHDVAMYQRRI